jgi:transposase
LKIENVSFPEIACQKQKDINLKMETRNFKNGQQTKKNSKYNRWFSEEFKRQKVKELDTNLITIKLICELHGVSRASVYKWLAKYSINYQQETKMVVQMESEAFKTAQLNQRVAELERIVGQKQMVIDYLNKVLEIASKEFDTDIKKKYGQEV